MTANDTVIVSDSRSTSQLSETHASIGVINRANQRFSDSASSAYKGTGTYSPNTQNTYQLGAPHSVMLGLNKSFGA